MKSLRFLLILVFAFGIANCFGFDKNCREILGGKKNYMSGYECFYAEQTLVQAYKYFRKSAIQNYHNIVAYKKLREKLEAEKDYIDL
ncbi:MAG: hypothetical protein LBP40_02515 [Campylobacteraceae bacterium]|nr:hypothetical protein [Campylobacteraceae bacterium]